MSSDAHVGIDDEAEHLLSAGDSLGPAEAVFRMDHGPSGPHWDVKPEQGEDFGYRLLDEIIAETSGVFQWRLTLLVAAANFVDAAETMMIGLLMPALEKEFNCDESQIVVVPALTNAGMFIGAVLFGQLSDKFGRRFTILISMGMCAVFGFFSSFANTLGLFTTFRFFLGIGYGGNLITSTTLLVEFVSTVDRGTFVILAGVGFGLGGVVIAGLSWVIVPAIGWRWLIRIAAFIAIPVLVALFFVPESARFYIMTRQYSSAVQTMQRVAAINNKEISHRFNTNTLEAVQFVDEEERVGFRVTVALLCRKPILKALVPLALCWLLNSFGSVVLNFVPLHASDTYSADDSTIYAVALVQAFGALLGNLCQMVVVQYVGRLFQIRLGFFIEGILILLLGLLASHGYGALLTLAFFTMFVAQFIIGTLYLYTPEAFPTRIRVSAFAVCQANHRVAPIASPFLVAALDKSGFEVTCYVYGCFFFVGLLFSFLVRTETFNRELLEESDFHEPRRRSLKSV